MVGCGLEAFDCAVPLGAALEKNFSLEELNLANNSLKVQGAFDIAKGLKYNKTLKKLDLSWNKLTAEGAEYILRACSDRAVNLRLLGNSINQEQLASLKAFSKKAENGESTGSSLEELYAATDSSSLYTLIGRVLNLNPAVAVHALCERFYLNLIMDPNILPFFGCITMGRMRNLQRDFLTEALGGPKVYKGLDLKSAHRHLRINDEHFDAVIDHLFAAVLHFIPDPPSSVVAALVNLTETVRPLVVNSEVDIDANDINVHTVSTPSQQKSVEDQYAAATDLKKAVPYFTTYMWTTGFFKRRGEEHPGLKVNT
ncbi:hypothetical protein CYMTET_22728 [Cymbomonas tetramitiformis]|uniref:Globin family profile domain-containing protein n=1 Tax=Cymbomonas tetramitiformis TaxID=36881 RepID=A0AAE0L1M2_9CHLO|nr:hypothetical protein CYMTET_22728 [Cymbomonas tetramitiformis]|eukprot:gene21461-25811_t